jgi:hypothetical protein
MRIWSTREWAGWRADFRNKTFTFYWTLWTIFENWRRRVISDLVQDVSAVGLHAVGWIGSLPVLTYLFGVIGVNTCELKQNNEIFCHLYGVTRMLVSSPIDHFRLPRACVVLICRRTLKCCHTHFDNQVDLKKFRGKWKVWIWSQPKLLVCCRTRQFSCAWLWVVWETDVQKQSVHWFNVFRIIISC